MYIVEYFQRRNGWREQQFDTLASAEKMYMTLCSDMSSEGEKVSLLERNGTEEQRIRCARWYPGFNVCHL